MSCADKPSQGLIIPDTVLTGAGSVERFPAEDGAVPGVVTSASDNHGKCFPVQKGRLASDSVDHTYEVIKAGGLYTGEFVYTTSNSFAYKGTHDPRRFWGWQTGEPNPVPGSNCNFIQYVDLFQWTLIGSVDTASNTATIRYKQDSEGYFGQGDEWQILTTLTFENQIKQTGNGHCECVVGSDGRLMLLVRIEGLANYGPDTDVDVYHSMDGGVTWTLVSERVIYNFTNDNTYADHNLTSQIRAAVSGEWIRLCYVNPAGRMITWLSRDRCVTWQRITLDVVAGDFEVGVIGIFVNDQFPFDIVDVNDSGLFLIACRLSTAGDEVTLVYSSGTGVWQFISIGLSVFQAPQQICQVCLVRTNDYIYLYAAFFDVGGNEDGWLIARTPPDQYQKVVSVLPAFPGWQQSIHPNNSGGLEFNPARTNAVWCGNHVAFYSASRSEFGAGPLNDLPSLWYQLGWDEYCVGLTGTTVRLDQAQTSSFSGGDWMFAHYWNPMAGDPASVLGAEWVKTIAGAGAAAFSLDRVTYIGNGIGDEANLQKTGIGLTNFGFPDNAAMIGFTVKLEPGSGDVFGPLTPGNDYLGLKIINPMSGGGGQANFSIRLQHDAIRLVSYGGSGPFDTVIPFNLTEWTEIRLSIQNVPGTFISFQLKVKNVGFDFWQVDVPLQQAFTFGPPGTGEIHWGHVDPQNVPAPWVSHWREFWITYKMDDSRTIIYPQRGDLFGLPLSPSEILTERGMYVAWTGSSAALSDTFTGTVEHTYPIESVFAGSPRIQWRSPNVPNSYVPENDFDPAFGWLPARSAGATIVTPNVEVNPFGDINTADSIQFSDIAGHASIPVLSFGMFAEPFSGITVGFWAKLVSSVPPGAEQLSVIINEGAATAPQSLTGNWQYFEFSIIAGIVPPFLDISIQNYTAATVYTFSVYGLTVKPQTYFVLRSDPEGTTNKRFDHNAASFFGTNVRRYLVDYDVNADFSTASSEHVSDSCVFDTDTTPLAVTQINDCEIEFVPNAKIIRGSLLGKYIRFQTGRTKVGFGNCTWRVMRHETNNVILVEKRLSATPQSAGATIGDEFLVFNNKSASYFESNERKPYCRVRIWDMDLASSDIQALPRIELGTMQLGKRLHIDVPLDWAITDNEQPNVTTYRTRSAITWAYNEGPSQRTITGRLVGDVERYREKLRFVLRYLEYETRPITLVMDEDSVHPLQNPSGPDERLMLCRITSGSQLDESAWYIDENGILRTAGDLSITFVEEV